MGEDERAQRPIPSQDVAWTERFEVPRFALRYRHLSTWALGEDHRIGVAIEELLPGAQSSPPHYHMLEEEHLYVLEGSLTLRLGLERHTMKAGDYVCFPAGQKAGHCLVNETETACRYVIVGERNPYDVVVYTDSNKLLVPSLGRRALFDLASRRGYWDGEDTGLPADAEIPDNASEAEIGPEPRPKPPIPIADVPLEQEDISPKFGGAIRHLTYAAVGADYHVGLLIEMPAPGKRLAPLHYHMREEEHALVLEGELTLLLGDERYPMGPGDYVAFPAGRRVGHSFMNSGSGPCRYLMIGARDRSDVCVYPNSGKMAVAGLDERANVFDMSARRRYWDGEA